MQFKVPQFLEIEDKIFGPFTFRQFIYIAGGLGMAFIVYRLLGVFWGALPILFIVGFAMMLAFYRPNDKPFINMVESGLKYVAQDKLYIWKRRKIKPGLKDRRVPETETASLRYKNSKLHGSKLRDLAWSLDVLDMKKGKGT